RLTRRLAQDVLEKVARVRSCIDVEIAEKALNTALQGCEIAVMANLLPQPIPLGAVRDEVTEVMQLYPERVGTQHHLIETATVARRLYQLHHHIAEPGKSKIDACVLVDLVAAHELKRADTKLTSKDLYGPIEVPCNVGSLKISRQIYTVTAVGIGHVQ